ncbi:MAG: hemolysin family protein [Lachnospiraceae bacterium]|nr:hemolysin family protein [Lachnospiraceae bacterium]
MPDIIILIVLLLLSGFFSGSETALTTVNRMKIRSLSEEGNKRASLLLKVHENRDKMLSCILICNNIVNIAATAIATTLALRISISVGIMTGILTVVVLIFGEIMPKNIAAVYSEPISLAIVRIIWVLMIIFTPVIWIIDRISRLLLFIFRVDLSKADNSMTESELRTIVDVSHEDGVIESNEKKLINNVFDFGDSTAKDIMIPRIDVTEININAGYEEIFEVFKEERYTRLPVYAGETDNIVGILNIKDFFVSDKNSFKVRDIMRDAFYTYESKKTSELMMDMKNESATVTVVINEYGASVGIITMEDLIEEIVGEIRDEYDEDEVDIIRETGEGEYLIQASIKLDDLNDSIGTDLDSEEYDSLGGYIIEKLDRLPQEGDVFEDENIRFEVMIVARNRVQEVKLTILKTETTEKEQEP